MDQTYTRPIYEVINTKKLKNKISNYSDYRISIPMEFVKNFNLKKGQKLFVKKDLLKKQIIYQINPFDVPTQLEWITRETKKDNRRNEKRIKKGIISSPEIKKSQEITWLKDNLKLINQKIKDFEESKIYTENRIKQLTFS